MKFVFILFSCIISAVFAAEAGTHAAGECPIKSGTSTYSYDRRSPHRPENWGDMKPEYSACKYGKRQSPIDFPTKDVKFTLFEDGPKSQLGIANMTFEAKSFNWNFHCVKEKTCGKTLYGGEPWHVVSLHFHEPSEHYLDGKQFPLESHIVHSNADGSEFAVIATVYDYPTDESFENKIYGNSGNDGGRNALIQAMIDGVKSEQKVISMPLSAVIDPMTGYCSYKGALTTPPCTEKVTFFMETIVQHVSKRQVHEYMLSAGASYDGNNRPLQSLNGREITCYVKEV